MSGKGNGSICGCPNYEIVGIFSIFTLLKKQWNCFILSCFGCEDCFLLNWLIQTSVPWQKLSYFLSCWSLVGLVFGKYDFLHLSNKKIFFKWVTSFFPLKNGVGHSELKWICAVGRKSPPTAAASLILFSYFGHLTVFLFLIRSEIYFYSRSRVCSRTYWKLSG